MKSSRSLCFYVTISNFCKLISDLTINLWSFLDIFALVFLILGRLDKRHHAPDSESSHLLLQHDYSALIYILQAMIWPFLFREGLTKQFICCMFVPSGVRDVLYTTVTLSNRVLNKRYLIPLQHISTFRVSLQNYILDVKKKSRNNNASWIISLSAFCRII